MKNVFHQNRLNAGTVQVHVRPTPILLIKSKNDEKLDKSFVKIKFRKGPTSEKLDLYEF